MPASGVDNNPEAWQMPQGGIDEGEKPRQAALRELREETGITPDLVEVVAKTHHWITYDLPPELLGKVWGGKYRGQRQKWFLMRFAAPTTQVQHRHRRTPNSRPGAGSMPTTLVAGIVPFKRAVYDQVVKSFRAYLA